MSLKGKMAPPAPDPDALAEEIRQGGMDVAYIRLAEGIAAFEKTGYGLDILIPPEDQATMGFSLHEIRDPRTFWGMYARVIRRDLCGPGKELSNLAKTGLAGSASSILTALLAWIGGAAATAIPVLAPIAGIIAASGVDVFCHYIAEAPAGELGNDRIDS